MKILTMTTRRKLSSSSNNYVAKNEGTNCHLGKLVESDVVVLIF
jgi:hypothetical protein